MKTTKHQLTVWADQCRGGGLSRRTFAERLLRIAGSVPLALALMHKLGIPAQAREIATPHQPQEKPLHCSFCGKDQNDVKKLIAGPTVFICDECVDVCNDIIADDNRFSARTGGATK